MALSALLVRLNAHRPAALADFFVQALGFKPDVVGANVIDLSLGGSQLQIIRCQGQAYPPFVPGWSPLFQHFAMAVLDMADAIARLEKAGGWTPISRGGPQQLPASSGGINAFKFRDPEGHPLELIGFTGEASALSVSINHSAISVADTSASVAFYQSLGLTIGSTSLNQGPEQDRLDGIEGAVVEVTALELPGSGPHVELLCYRGRHPRAARWAALDDVAATRLAWTTGISLDSLATRSAAHVVSSNGPGGPLLLRDPRWSPPATHLWLS